MILYIENPEDFTEKLLELTDELSKVAGYKINLQKSIVFLYTNNEISERESIETILFKITSKTNKQKNLGMKLITEVKDSYSENYKTMMKEIKYQLKKLKDIQALGLEELILLNKN